MKIKTLHHHARREVESHPFDYTLLVIGSLFFLMAIYLFLGEKLPLFITFFLFTSFYIIWGIYHHAHQNTLILRTVIEYILIGFIFIFLLKIYIFP